MLPIAIEIISGPPLNELFTKEGEEVQFLVADRGGHKAFRVGRIVSVELDGVALVIFDNDLYKGTLFEGIHNSKLCCRGRLLFQSRPGMG